MKTGMVFKIITLVLLGINVGLNMGGGNTPALANALACIYFACLVPVAK